MLSFFLKSYNLFHFPLNYLKYIFFPDNEKTLKTYYFLL